MKNNNTTKESKELVTKTKMKLWKKIVITILIFILLAIVAFVTYEKSTVNNTYYIGEKNLQIPVFVYHDIVGDESQIQYDYMQTTYDTFKKQITGLMKLGYKPISYQDLEDYKNGKKAIPKWSFVITFDDGYKNFNTIVKPIIKKYNLQATNFVIGYKTKINNPLYLQTNDLKNDQYVEYYSHSYDMHHIGHLPYKKKIETMTTNEIKKDFEKNKGLVSTDYFAFPYGVSCQNAQDYLKSSSVKLAFSYNQNRHMTCNDKQYLLPRYLMFSNMPFPLFKWWIE